MKSPGRIKPGRDSSNNRKRERLIHAAQVGAVFRLYGNLFAGLDEKGTCTTRPVVIVADL